MLLESAEEKTLSLRHIYV